MEIQYVNVKLYSETQEVPDFKEFIPIFHHWIQKKAFDELLIDVADYSHVPAGPGIILIGHEANYSVENGPEERFGLLYNTKIVREGTNQDRIHYALQQAAKAAIRLQQDEFRDGRLKFSGQEVRLTINSRQLAPNEDASLIALRNDLQSVFGRYYGASNNALDRVSNDPRERFAVRAKAFVPVELASLLAASQASLAGAN
ncbi:MAG: hypothetical protein ACE5G1_10415 [bacterium]